MAEACPFCTLNSSELVFHDEFVFAVWDRSPVSDGHLLLITQRHIPDWFDASNPEQHALMAGIAKGREMILRRFAPNGFNIGINVGQVAGQTLPHLHVHLIPRYTGDDLDPRRRATGDPRKGQLSSGPAINARSARETIRRRPHRNGESGPVAAPSAILF